MKDMTWVEWLILVMLIGIISTIVATSISHDNRPIPAKDVSDWQLVTEKIFVGKVYKVQIEGRSAIIVFGPQGGVAFEWWVPKLAEKPE